MYSNIGEKIKLLTKILTVIFAVASVIGGIALIAVGITLGGVLLIILAPILLCLFSFFMYAYGELVEKVCNIEKAMYSSEGVKSQVKEEAQKENLDKYKKLRDEGLISENEYQQIISREERA